MPSSRYCSDYPRNLLVPLSFSWFISLAVGPYPWLFLIGLHKSSILHSRGGRVLSFQLSVGLALSYSVKPLQPGSLAGPITKSTTIILIRDRGQGWQWKCINISIAESSSFHCVLTSHLPEHGWSKAEESSSFCRVLTSQLLEWLEQGSASFMGESCCLGNRTLRMFWGPKLFSGYPRHRKPLPSWLRCGGSKDDSCNFNRSRSCQDNCVGACPNGLKCFLFLFLNFNPYLNSWLIGMNPIAQRNGCPF